MTRSIPNPYGAFQPYAHRVQYVGAIKDDVIGKQNSLLDAEVLHVSQALNAESVGLYNNAGSFWQTAAGDAAAIDALAKQYWSWAWSPANPSGFLDNYSLLSKPGPGGVAVSAAERAKTYLANASTDLTLASVQNPGPSQQGGSGAAPYEGRGSGGAEGSSSSLVIAGLASLAAVILFLKFGRR